MVPWASGFIKIYIVISGTFDLETIIFFSPWGDIGCPMFRPTDLTKKNEEH